MPKFTLTIECATQDELTEIVQHLSGPLIVSTVSSDAMGDVNPFPDEPQELETQAEAAPAPALETPPASAPAKRGRPKKADLKPGEPKLNGNGEQHLPDLDALKNAVVSAVKAARLPGGSATVLDLLPEFKEKTGLQFVMDAKDEHRQALFDLIQKAGLELA